MLISVNVTVHYQITVQCSQVKRMCFFHIQCEAGKVSKENNVQLPKKSVIIQILLNNLLITVVFFVLLGKLKRRLFSCLGYMLGIRAAHTAD